MTNTRKMKTNSGIRYIAWNDRGRKVFLAVAAPLAEEGVVVVEAPFDAAAELDGKVEAPA